MGVTKRSITLGSPGLFAPSIVHDEINNRGQFVEVDGSSMAETNIDSSASFRYDSPGAGLRSTQQVNTDFSKFQNHTFFNSAEVNVNVAFDKIINKFPFDGTRREIEAFLDDLSGFEHHVYDRFPKNRGYLQFFTSLGTHINVYDYAGVEYPTISKNQTGDNVLDPGMKSLTLEMQLYVAPVAGKNQVICQKLSGSTYGVTLGLDAMNSTSTCMLRFMVSSGSSVLQTSASIAKGAFKHIAATFDRRDTTNNVKIYIDEVLSNTCKSGAEFGLLDFKTSPLTIGSGSTHITGSGAKSFVAQETLSGAIDELRVWHSVRAEAEQKEYAKKSVFQNEDLVLYFKFNEPSGSFAATAAAPVNSMVIDYSGNSLHSSITGFSFGLRSTGSVAHPMTHEKSYYSPVLFPGYGRLRTLNTELMTSASLYDAENPNLITRLFPQHYFDVGQASEGLATVSGSISDGYSGTEFQTGISGKGQMFQMLLYTYAKFFDELKVMIDAFRNMYYVDYDTDENVPDAFLHMLAERYGFKLPGLFSDSSMAQFVDAENEGYEIGTATYSLRYVQNQLLRRILASMRDIILSKGTIHSVKAFFRSLGIDPDNSLRIREFGGPTKSTLAALREKKSIVTTMLYLTASGARLQSGYLSGSRTEIGWPDPCGTMVKKRDYFPHGISNNRSDGLFTSGSWTCEGVYKLATSATPTITQSLMRMCVTSSATLTQGMLGSANLLLNIVAMSGSSTEPSVVRLYARPGWGSSTATTPVLSLHVTGADVHDGNRWYVACGRQRNDDIGIRTSSSYFLHLERRVDGLDPKVFHTASFFEEAVKDSLGARLDMFTYLNSVASRNVNSSGTFVVIGQQTITAGSSATVNPFLNNTTFAPAEARVTAFKGGVGPLRFWSKALSYTEMTEHAKNFKSLGVDDPYTNFSFSTTLTGAFERLRVDMAMDQPAITADVDGKIQVYDFSQNQIHGVASGLHANTSSFIPSLVTIDQISPALDELASIDKVRVRSYLQQDNVDDSVIAAVAPVYELPKSEPVDDDVRFAIDFSIVDALNRDIVNVFAALDEFDNALGNTNVMSCVDYPSLDVLGDVYFNRLVDKVNVRSFMDFFKWIDSSLGTVVAQLLPKKTKYLGMNFVVENHLLERAKIRYWITDPYVGADTSRRPETTVLLEFYDTSPLFSSVKRF